MNIKIWVAQNEHDNDCEIFSDFHKAITHFGHCSCKLVEMKKRSGAFEPTGLRIFHWRCENCGKRGRSDLLQPVDVDSDGGYRFCSELCKEETEAFYRDGNCGSFGSTTRDSKAKAIERVSGDCYCWTTDENRIRGQGEPVFHYKNCPLARSIEEVTA